MNYEEKYKLLKKWLFKKGIEIPISIEPYTQEEYLNRIEISELYWNSRDYEAVEWEKDGIANWITSN